MSMEDHLMDVEHNYAHRLNELTEEDRFNYLFGSEEIKSEISKRNDW